MKSYELLKSKESQILLATYKLASEGFSLAKLNCLLFATSRTSITQAIGRIYRQKHEITPIIVDIYDDFSYFKSQYYKRRKTYKELISNCIFKNFTSKNSKSSVTLDLPEVNNKDTLDFEVDSD
jgi:superfamily II DNA or RNA helicase